MLKLKEIRIKKGFSQHDIAIFMGVAQATISKYELGNRKLNHDQVVKLSLLLDVTPDELLDFKEAYEKYTKYLEQLAKENKKN